MNLLRYLTVGISDKGVGYATAHITGNQFYNNQKGFELRQGNSSPSNPALFQIKCNDFVKAQQTPGFRTFGMFIANGATLNAQGGCPNPGLGIGLEAMANNEFLSDGYPIQYINNGTLSVFAPGYDWFNDFYGIANNNPTPLVYTAAGNENLGLSPTVKYTGVAALVCLDANLDPIPSNTQTCPTYFGVANKPVKLSTQLDKTFSIYPNPTSGLFNIKPMAGLQIQIIQVFNLLGEQILIQEFNSSSKDFIVDISSSVYPSGVYTIQVIDVSGEVETGSVFLVK